MFCKLIEEIRDGLQLEYRSGRYGRYYVARPASHISRFLGGLGKLGKGAIGLGTLGTVHVGGDHPGTDDDAQRKADDERRSEANRRRAEADRKKSDVKGPDQSESIRNICGILAEMRDALDERMTKAQQYHGMMAQHPDEGIRKNAATNAGKERAAELVSKAKDRNNQLAPQLIKAFRQDNRQGHAKRDTAPPRLKSEARSKEQQLAGLAAVAPRVGKGAESRAELQGRRMASRRGMGGVLMGRQNMRERGALRGYPQIKADILDRSKVN